MRLKLIAIVLSTAFLLTGFGTGIKRPNSPRRKLAGTDSLVLGTKTIISNLNVPWEITWGPDNWIWFTEQSGTVSKVNPNTGERKVLLRIPEVFRIRSLGLLGMAIFPDKKKPYIFLDHTYKNGSTVLSRLVRYTYTADTLMDPIVLLKDIPGANSHNGSRIAISPDGKVFMSTGYATKTTNSQDDASLNGKILRINPDGSIPADNPVPGSPIWSRGHRNPQGLAFTDNGILFSSEHGDAIEDELNMISRNGNYGWPYVEGFCSTPEEEKACSTTKITEPVKSWTPVIAPAGIEYYNSAAIPEWKNSVLMVTLKTQSLRILKLDHNKTAVLSEAIYLDHQLGRLRDVCVSPSGDVYVATSNRDWNPAEGYPKADDDRIVKLIKPAAGKTISRSTGGNQKTTKNNPPAYGPIYNNYCGSCHKSNGSGVPGVFPSLINNAVVNGNTEALLSLILKGSKASAAKKSAYDQEMPAFNFLSDKEIASVATYIRANFKNKAGVVTAPEVLKVRNKK